MTRTTRWFLLLMAVGLVLAAVFVAVGFLATRVSAPHATSTTGEGAVLRIELSGPYPEEDPDRALGALFGSTVVSLPDLIAALDRAATDAHVAGLELRVAPLSVGWARAGEIRDALLRFRKSGKPVYGWMEAADDGSYYVGRAADDLRLAPTGTLFLDGIDAEVQFWGGTFEKLGIRADLEQIGEYKNAADTMKRKDMTPAHREAMESLVGGLYDELVRGLAESLDRSEADVQNLIGGGPYTAERARGAGLVDGVGFEDQTAEALDTRLGGGHHERIDLPDYVRALAPSRRGRTVAVVNCVGTIVSGGSTRSLLGGASMGADTISEAIRTAVEDDDAVAVILRIDSPGGSATASDTIWRAARRMHEKHSVPLVVSMGDVAASGGYWIATQADEVLADPSTITGSIGVFGGKYVFGDLEQRVGLNTVPISRGANATFGSSLAPYDDAQRANLRDQLQATYHLFLERTRDGRHFASSAEVDAIARGRVWTGRQAHDRHLVDKIGGLREAVAEARRLAKIGTDEPIVLRSYPRPPTLLDVLRHGGASSMVTALVRPAIAREVAAELPVDLSEAAAWAAIARRLAGAGPLALSPVGALRAH